MNNSIGVTLNPGERDTDNNFVDSNKGSISGTVKDDEGNPLVGVEIQLQDPASGDTVATVVTDSNGAYTFPEVEPGTYMLVVEKNPNGYPGDVSNYDSDSVNDGDDGNGEANADNKIPAVLMPGEDDIRNDFVDGNNGLISGTVKDDNGNVTCRRVLRSLIKSPMVRWSRPPPPTRTVYTCLPMLSQAHM